jgi:uncharacterized membrane protein
MIRGQQSTPRNMGFSWSCRRSRHTIFMAIRVGGASPGVASLSDELEDTKIWQLAVQRSTACIWRSVWPGQGLLMGKRMCIVTIQKQAQRVHHISSHFTNGLFPAASVCITLFLLTGAALFEDAVLCCVAIGTIASPVVYGSGLLDWQVRFKRRPARIFARKRYVGGALVLTSVLLIAVRLSLGREVATIGASKYIYAGVIYLITGMATYLGHLGGRFIV